MNPGGEGALRHHPAGAARGQPGGEPVRGDARGGRPRQPCAAARASAAPRRRSTGAPTSPSTSAARSSSRPSAARFPGAEVTSLDVSDLTRIEEDVAMEFTLDVPRYALADGSGLRFTPFGDVARLRRVLRRALLPPSRPRPRRPGRHAVHVPLRAADGLGAGRGARGRRRGHAARRVRGALPPRGGRARRRGARHVQDGARRGGGLPRLPRVSPRGSIARSRGRSASLRRPPGRPLDDRPSASPRSPLAAAALLALAARLRRSARRGARPRSLRDRPRGARRSSSGTTPPPPRRASSRALARRATDPWAHLGAALLARRALDARRRGPPPPRGGRGRARRPARARRAAPAVRARRGVRRRARREIEAGLAPLVDGGRLAGLAAYRARIARVTAAEVRGDHAARGRAPRARTAR